MTSSERQKSLQEEIISAASNGLAGDCEYMTDRQAAQIQDYFFSPQDYLIYCVSHDYFSADIVQVSTHTLLQEGRYNFLHCNYTIK